ncbi:uncharacterized protein LOC131943182 [Physella acuta]|uniref:uncharacterized protein LOC131943182 n=1 Tax=Physella acuta TaxID=109671 RepID=UPI0027DB4CC1|nr:uncharacterized protein LOC131943182 [Physella acuta]
MEKDETDKSNNGRQPDKRKAEEENPNEQPVKKSCEVPETEAELECARIITWIYKTFQDYFLEVYEINGWEIMKVGVAMLEVLKEKSRSKILLKVIAHASQDQIVAIKEEVYRWMIEIFPEKRNSAKWLCPSMADDAPAVDPPVPLVELSQDTPEQKDLLKQDIRKKTEAIQMMLSVQLSVMNGLVQSLQNREPSAE